MDKKIKRNSKKNDLKMSVQTFHKDVSNKVASNKIVSRFYCHMTKKFFVPLWPGNGGGDDAMNPESACFKESRQGLNDLFMQCRVFHDTSLADAIPAHLELRLDEGYNGGIDF